MSTKTTKALVLSKEFKYVLKRLETDGASMFITGRAGTGKSTLLHLFRRQSQKKIVVLAPTGVAALNVRGQTIHSFFGFPPSVLRRKDVEQRQFRRVFELMEVLVIDEISMVRADLLDGIDIFLRNNRNKPQPFGGVQVVFFGDLFQLPPIVGQDEALRAHLDAQYASPYFFSAHVMQRMLPEALRQKGPQDYALRFPEKDLRPLEIFELTRVFRQENQDFLRLLEGVRSNRLSHFDLQALNARWAHGFALPKDYLIVAARNQTVDHINAERLAEIPQPLHVFEAGVSGDVKPSSFPTDQRLHLKVGAQVMFLRNDPDRRYVNGTLATVLSFEEQGVRLRLNDESELATPLDEDEAKNGILLLPYTWESIRYKVDKKNPKELESEVVGSFTQLPLRLAWAITIHKSQGRTYDKVVIDLGRGAFEHGQTYVALSRCRTLEGIILQHRLNMRDIITDERIVQFYDTLHRLQAEGKT